ncbi:unnamed protein product [Protopolystoma xenopodis]|uniref:Uncharacterized protein n=1 Tax=Protopolystoma xenopodis TaxID=117903 RepID=A0A448WTE9_9PLAT|nr:unnamed protein product [Protopolystoma xenopodis]
MKTNKSEKMHSCSPEVSQSPLQETNFPSTFTSKSSVSFPPSSAMPWPRIPILLLVFLTLSRLTGSTVAPGEPPQGLDTPLLPRLLDPMARDGFAADSRIGGERGLHELEYEAFRKNATPSPPGGRHDIVESHTAVEAVQWHRGVGRKAPRIEEMVFEPERDLSSKYPDNLYLDPCKARESGFMEYAFPKTDLDTNKWTN